MVNKVLKEEAQIPRCEDERCVLALVTHIHEELQTSWYSIANLDILGGVKTGG